MFWQYSWVNPGGLPTPFATDEILYFRMRPSSRETYGTSKLEIIKNIVNYLQDGTEAISKYFENGLFIGGQIDFPDVKDPKQLQQLASRYKAELQGPKKMNKWMVTGGGTKITNFEFTPTEMQFLDGQKWYAKMVMAIFNVAPSELGFTEDLNRATGIQQMNIHKSRAVKPILSIIEEVINRGLVWKMDKELSFRYTATLDLDDEMKQSQIDQIDINIGKVTVNELRKRDGLEPYENETFNEPFATLKLQTFNNLISDESTGNWNPLNTEDGDNPWDESKTEEVEGVDTSDKSKDSQRQQAAKSDPTQKSATSIPSSSLIPSALSTSHQDLLDFWREVESQFQSSLPEVNDNSIGTSSFSTTESIEDRPDDETVKGGDGSGDFNHNGRPNLVGGSSKTKCSPGDKKCKEQQNKKSYNNNAKRRKEYAEMSEADKLKERT